MSPTSTEHFFNYSLDLNCIASMDGMFLELNDRWSEVLGYTLDELKSKPFMDYVHPEDIESTVQAMSQLGNSLDVLNFRNRYCKADGSYTWLEWNAYPPKEDEYTIFATARCIDRLVSFETGLERKNSLLTTMMQAQNSFIRQGATELWWNHILEKILLFTNSSYGFIGQIFMDDNGLFLRNKTLINPQANPTIQTRFENHLSHGAFIRELDPVFGRCLTSTEPWFVNNQMNNAVDDIGETLSFNTFVSIPIVDDTGLKGIIGLGDKTNGYTSEDVNELSPIISLLSSVFFSVMLVENAQESKKDFLTAQSIQQAVLENSESGIVVIDHEGGLALMNDRARELLRGLHLRHPKTKRSVLQWFEYWFTTGDELNMLKQFLEPSNDRKSNVFHLKSIDNTNENIHHPVDVSATWLSLISNESSYPLLLTISDRSDSIELTKKNLLNAELEEKIRQLREAREHNEVLSECVEFLQSCTTQAEGLSLIANYLNRFYPNRDDGVLYGIYEADHGSFQRIDTNMETCSEHPLERTALECWALRSRRVYAYCKEGHRLACRHTGPETVLEFCVPLFSLDKIVAVFSISYTNMTTDIAKNLFESKLPEFTSFSQSLSGALSTIALRESLQRLALTDELTNLPNRRSFQDSTRKRIALARRQKHPFIIAMMDIDHFKQINDTFGHDVGDRVLRQMGTIITRFFRAEDLYGRVGGEEFAIFMGQCGPEEAKKRFTELIKEIPDAIKLPDRNVTVSLGFINSENHTNVEEYAELILKADQALYHAKQTGRNQWVYFADISQ